MLGVEEPKRRREEGSAGVLARARGRRRNWWHGPVGAQREAPRRRPPLSSVRGVASVLCYSTSDVGPRLDANAQRDPWEPGLRVFRVPTTSRRPV